eukprot:m.38431 g.38431  ORF g.38431 m.38431 type:complete len:60 (+) comp7828_c0_seq1:23-202(+)
MKKVHSTCFLQYMHEDVVGTSDVCTLGGFGALVSLSTGGVHTSVEVPSSVTVLTGLRVP